ncbi:hypothetical protein C8R45DRAFT_1107248 [Mycena sanguinolenta]|nr:hypothetical protein C8R45DRAFT_1107248 [Mycena sanguinolenta]
MQSLPKKQGFRRQQPAPANNMIPLRHIPPLFVATALTFGNVWPSSTVMAPFVNSASQNT